MTTTTDEAFEVRVIKRVGDQFQVEVDVTGGELTDRDAALEAIQLLVLHLENKSGLESWDAGRREGEHAASD